MKKLVFVSMLASGLLGNFDVVMGMNPVNDSEKSIPSRFQFECEINSGSSSSQGNVFAEANGAGNQGTNDLIKEFMSMFARREQTFSDEMANSREIFASQLKSLVSQVEGMRADITELKAQNQDLKSENARLQSELDNHDRSIQQKALEEQKKANELKEAQLKAQQEAEAARQRAEAERRRIEEDKQRRRDEINKQIRYVDDELRYQNIILSKSNYPHCDGLIFTEFDRRKQSEWWKQYYAAPARVKELEAKKASLQSQLFSI